MDWQRQTGIVLFHDLLRMSHSGTSRFLRIMPGLFSLFVFGCSSAPKNFLSMNDPTAINRARAVAFNQTEPDAVAIPVMIDRLMDDDPVVRLASHESLKKRTGQDFGYLPYAEGEELSTSVARWRAWWSSASQGRMYAASPQTNMIPRSSAQSQLRQSRLGPRPLSEAQFKKKRGPLQRLFGR
ncbi:MAG: hypothetical protein RJA81_2281 [Planctomycetota bacterium]